MAKICMSLDKFTELHKIFTELQLVFFNLFHELETEKKLSNNFSKNRTNQNQSHLFLLPFLLWRNIGYSCADGEI